jgi:hypothetical protein
MPVRLPADARLLPSFFLAEGRKKQERRGQRGNFHAGGSASSHYPPGGLGKIGSFFENIIIEVRKFLARLKGKPFIRVGKCNQCGTCCRLLTLFVDGKQLSTAEEFQHAREVFPEYWRFYASHMDEEGRLLYTCSFLREDNTCNDYQARPHICRKYPTSGILYQGGKLVPQCGFNFIPTKDFQEDLERSTGDKYKGPGSTPEESNGSKVTPAERDDAHPGGGDPDAAEAPAQPGSRQEEQGEIS